MDNSVFKDPNGKISITRVVWSISVFLVIFTWTYISIKNGELAHFTAGDSAIFVALLGLKVGQSFAENTNKT